MTTAQTISDMTDAKALLDQARQASDFLKALSHETRLMMLCMLCEAEMSVSELEQALAMPQAAVSQQLARLRLDKLVDTRRDGRMVFYRIASPEVAGVIQILHDLFCKPKKAEIAAE